MNEFELGRDPLAEPINDEELHELLNRLGEAEFGGEDRATVGAVVEARGLDASTVLRTLGEIRQRALDAQREALAAMERRVSRLEARPSKPPRDVHVETEETPEKTTSAGVIVALAAFAFILLVVHAVGGSRRSSPSGTIISTAVDDGKLIVGSDGAVEVIRPDGTKREPTSYERILSQSLESDFKEMDRGRLTPP